ncbi:hypothetical protein [Streptomyces chartreusis]|uniref:hypothetical protein n=1 Tax=Streptomyces chartreusis TaxID=1969 RepID=UPI00123D8BF9|nr:hypothetical protein [Streptomyces chartreusis]QEV66207.1 hypothetical protein CP983_05715 [Streptomyces chartreusis]GGW98660.1 hypothetical protein GCM10010321_11310 [Streptomyces chartreusis]
MSVSEAVRKLGSWEIKLAPGIPRDTLDALEYFGHVAIVPGRNIPVAQYGDALLDVARYVGVVRTRTWGDDGRTNAVGDDLSVGGVGMAMWLGDEDDKGDVFENAIAPASATFATTINMLLPASGAVTAGTIHSVSGQYTGRHQYETPRAAIDYVCDTMSTESVPVSWRVNGNGTLDAGPESDLYVTTPQCIIVTRGAGEDMAMRALVGSTDVTRDVEDYSTRVLLLAEGEGASIATGSANVFPATGYKDIHGNALVMTRMVSESDTSTGNANTRAQLQLNRFTSTRSALTLSTADYDIHGTFDVGDYVWVYDPDAGLVDTANEVTFRGHRLNPIKLQVTEVQWSVTDAYTVAYRAGDGTWWDLSRYFVPETDTTVSVTVGDIQRALTAAGTEPVGSRPNTDTSIPGVPTFVEPFVGAAYLDDRGYTRARVILTWNAPLNVDGSTVLDGDHYDVRFAIDTDMIYPATWSQVSQVRWQDMQIWAQPFAAPNAEWQYMTVGWDQGTAELLDLSPGIGYDVQIRAVDKAGNVGAWSATTTFVATSDNIPPSTPAAPSVAGSRIALQITHELGKSSGGTFNLESDLQHLEIHVDYEPYFTPSASTLKGKVSATAGMIQAQIPVVATVQIEETSTRYVRVVAVDKAGNKSGPSEAASSTALLIDDAHISDLTVSKVTAGSILADWVVAARLKTADTGPRAEMSASGFEAYNAGGDRTFFADAATGNVSIIGQLVSGSSGKRLEINPTATFLPELRFFANEGSNYAYINASSGGTDSNIGVNSGLFDDGGGTDVFARVFLSTNTSEIAIVTEGQDRRGGFVRLEPDVFYSGFHSDGLDGGIYLATTSTARIGWNDGTDATTNQFYFQSNQTRHFGRWRDFAAAESNEGLFTGSVNATSGATSFSATYGPTMLTQPLPITSIRDDIVHSYAITASDTTGFTLTISPAASGAWAVYFWCFRI